MTIWPLPGVPGDQLLAALQRVHDEAGTVGAGPMGEAERLQSYLRWTENAASQLRLRIRSADFIALVRNAAYWAIVQSRGTEGSAGLILTEMRERTAALHDAITSLQAAIRHWAPAPGGDRLFVPDTNVWVSHANGLQRSDWRRMPATPVPSTTPLRLVVPIIVIDELDKLKRKSQVRPQASRALKTLYGWLGSAPTSVAVIHAADGSTASTTIQVLYDDAGHVRLPSNDDEL